MLQFQQIQQQFLNIANKLQQPSHWTVLGASLAGGVALNNLIMLGGNSSVTTWVDKNPLLTLGITTSTVAILHFRENLKDLKDKAADCAKWFNEHRFISGLIVGSAATGYVAWKDHPSLNVSQHVEHLRTTVRTINNLLPSLFKTLFNKSPQITPSPASTQQPPALPPTNPSTPIIQQLPTPNAPTPVEIPITAASSTAPKSIPAIQQPPAPHTPAPLEIPITAASPTAPKSIPAIQQPPAPHTPAPLEMPKADGIPHSTPTSSPSQTTDPSLFELLTQGDKK